MNPAPLSQITELLQAWSGGDQKAYDQVVEALYPELRRIAQASLSRERSGQTIRTTALVHEAYLRLIEIRQIRWQDRAHFFAVSARVMRRILIDHARGGHSARRGGGFRRVELKEALAVSSELGPQVLQVDEALQELAQFDSRKAQVVEMRFFGGLTAAEIASVLGVSTQTVNRDWSLAKAWLARAMTRRERDGRPARRTTRAEMNTVG